MFTMTAPPVVYQQRRARLAKCLDEPLAILAGYAYPRHYATNPQRFRATSTYLYYGGPPIEGAVLVVEPGCDGASGCHLLRPAPGPDDPLWLGVVPADAELAQAAGLPESAVCDLDCLADLFDSQSLSALGPPHTEALQWMKDEGLLPAGEAERLAVIMQRLIKDEYEIAALRRAAAVTVEAHAAMWSATRPGATEADVEAALYAVLVRQRCRPSFTPIVTVEGQVLHGENHGRTLQAGALLLADAGAEEPGGYAGDVTRTVPVSGTFTPVQRFLYDTVARAQRSAVSACTPGRRYREVHTLAARVITEGLVQADLLHGDVDDLTERGAYALFFPHGVGHLLGLDVHDLEEFGDLAGYAPGRTRPARFGDKFLRLDRDLEPGMVVTIEPGIYLVPALWQRDDLVQPFADVVNRPAVDALLRDQFGGIRIEDDILVTPEGPENLTAALPIEAEAVGGAIQSSEFRI